MRSSRIWPTESRSSTQKGSRRRLFRSGAKGTRRRCRKTQGRRKALALRMFGHSSGLARKWRLRATRGPASVGLRRYSGEPGERQRGHLGVVAGAQGARAKPSLVRGTQGQSKDADKEECGLAIPGSDQKDGQQRPKAALQREVAAPADEGGRGEVIRKAEGYGKDKVEEAQHDQEREGKFWQRCAGSRQAVDPHRRHSGEKQREGGGDFHHEELRGVEDGAMQGEVLERRGVAGGEHGPAHQVPALKGHALCSLGVAGEVDIGWTGGAVEISEPDGYQAVSLAPRGERDIASQCICRGGEKDLDGVAANPGFRCGRQKG